MVCQSNLAAFAVQTFSLSSIFVYENEHWFSVLRSISQTLKTPLPVVNNLISCPHNSIWKMFEYIRIIPHTEKKKKPAANPFKSLQVFQIPIPWI